MSSESLPADAFTTLRAIVEDQRTNMLVDRDREVSEDIVRDLVSSQCGHRTINARGLGGLRLSRVTAGFDLARHVLRDLIAGGSDDEFKIQKVRSKYTRVPACSSLGADNHATFHDENRDAVSAGIQNALLGATSLGLASVLVDGTRHRWAHTLELCGFESGTRLIGMIYLGWPTGDTLPSMRPDLEINIIVVGQAYLINLATPCALRVAIQNLECFFGDVAIDDAVAACFW